MPADGFSVVSVCIEAQDRSGLERLLRYCARPPFAMERLRKQGSALVCRCTKQHSDPVGGKVADIILAPLVHTWSHAVEFPIRSV